MPLTLEDELGDILQKARDGKSWSQEDLARAAGHHADARPDRTAIRRRPLKGDVQPVVLGTDLVDVELARTVRVHDEIQITV